MQSVAVNVQPGHLAGDHPIPPAGQPVEVVAGRLGPGVGEQHDVVAQLPEEQRLVHGHRAAEDADRLVANLPPVAVRTVQHIAAPPLGKPGHVRQQVGHAGGDQQSARMQGPGSEPVLSRFTTKPASSASPNARGR